jgi:hypothetical protein
MTRCGIWTCGGKLIATSMLVMVASLSISARASADEADAKKTLKNMTVYMANQKTMSFSYDASLEFVTKDNQKIMLANSGTLNLSRPDKIRTTRNGGFSDVEMIFDGKTLTVFHKDANEYAQADAAGNLEHLIDELRSKYHKPAPGADLLLPNAYEALMSEVTDVKDLGSGVIGGKECDHFAFRAKDVDWQIWIAQGDRPYPCRYVITSKDVDQAPEYSIQLSDWKTGSEVAVDNFSFANRSNARKVEVVDLGDVDELPKQFTGDAR